MFSIFINILYHSIIFVIISFNYLNCLPISSSSLLMLTNCFRFLFYFSSLLTYSSNKFITYFCYRTYFSKEKIFFYFYYFYELILSSWMRCGYQTWIQDYLQKLPILSHISHEPTLTVQLSQQSSNSVLRIETFPKYSFLFLKVLSSEQPQLYT